MLVGAFLLGFILHWLICRARHQRTTAKSRHDIVRPSTTVSRQPSRPDNLQIIEGIGPKIESLLETAGISTFAQLARSPATKIKSILDDAGPRFQMHDPTSWIEQAALARDGKMKELEALKDKLTGGRH
jgi:predicted flap endonuclease-1-like 5' DNA nuclease